jgi:acetyl esterase/lipase
MKQCGMQFTGMRRYIPLALCWFGLGHAGVATALDAPQAVPKTGLYVEQLFQDSQLRKQFDLPYSVRPNAGDQFTSDLTKQAEQNAPTLTMRLDVAMPPNATADKPQPLLVWIHGGDYRQGSKEETHDKALTYARAGYVVAAVNYRLTPDNETSPERRQMAVLQANEDVMNAIRYLKSRASTFHIDSTRIATMGSSAGGGISLVNAVEFDTLVGAVSDYPGVSSKVAAAVSTGATLIESSYDSDQFLHYDATDTPVLLFHAKPNDSVTGATWQDNVEPTVARINGSGNICYPVAQKNMTHTISLAIDGPGIAWPYIRPFLWNYLRLAELR